MFVNYLWGIKLNGHAFEVPDYRNTSDSCKSKTLQAKEGFYMAEKSPGQQCLLFQESLVYSAMVQGVQNPTAMRETQDSRVWSLGWEDPLEEERATHSSVLAWRVPGTEEPGGLQSMVSQTHQCIPSIIHSLLHPTLEECTDFLCFHEWILSVLVLVFYCCITNYYKSKSLKQHSRLSA